MKKLELKQLPEVKKWLTLRTLRPSELQISNLFMWRYKYKFSFTVESNYLWISNESTQDTYFSMPFGNFDNAFDLQKSIETIKKSFNKEKLFLKKCDDYFIEKLKVLDIPFEYEAIRDDFDYVYSLEDLKHLKGNRYHKKKNHVNHFTKKYNWTYKKLTIENFNDIHQVNEKWFENADDDLLLEKEAINELMVHYDYFSCHGGILYVDELPIAYTIGEIINKDTLVIHFEKALTDYEGAYTMIMNRYLQDFSDLEFVNREQDMGIEGLRKSKLSYHPVDFINKYNVIL